MNIGSSSQPTDFALDVLGRYVCNTFDEALANSDPVLSRQRAGRERQCPAATRRHASVRLHHHWRRHVRLRRRRTVVVPQHRSGERILVLEGGPFLLAEHMQNLPFDRLGREVWGLAWNAAPILGYPWARLLRRRALDLVGRVVAAAARFRDRHRLAAGHARRSQCEEAPKRRQWLFPPVRTADRRHCHQRLHLRRAAPRHA